MPPRPLSLHRWAQQRALTATFLARFFEHEATAGATDMRQSFFWLVAFLATPGIFLPLYMAIRWANVAADRGVDALRLFSLVDKTIYFGLSFVGVGLVSALIWHTLIVDRRDGLVLGGLPVRFQTICSSKLLALALYVVLLSLGMHGPAALLYGAGLGSVESLGAIGRNTLALIIAGSAANVFVLVTIAGVQSVCLAVMGPRRFARVSPWLQVLVVAVTTLLLLAIPATAVGVLHVASGRASAPSLLWLPPLWFVGLYESIVGTSLPLMSMLANRAIVGLLISMSVLLLSYPLASRRSLLAAIEGGGTAKGAWVRRLGHRIPCWLSADPHERAIVEFMLSAILRTHENRLVLCVLTGAGVATVMPLAAAYVGSLSITAAQADGPMLAAPLLLMFALASGIRLAAAVPSEIKAAWMFAAAPAPMLAGRRALRRVMLVFGIAAPLAVVSPIWIWSWGVTAGLTHLAACALAGSMLTDTLLWGFVGIPCAKPMAPQRANLQFRWPAIATGLYFFTYEFPRWQIVAMDRWGSLAVLVPLLLAKSLVRRASARAAYVNGVSGDPHAILSLNLETLCPIRTT